MKDLSSLPDNKLSQAIKSSNSAAFKTLYFRHYESLYNFVWYRTYSAELAKDILQETFTRLWQNRKKLNVNKSIKAYLYRIANNLIIDYNRKNTSKRSYLSKLERENYSDNEQFIDTELSLKTALDNLPEKLRTVFTLSRYQGLKYSEIAEVCNISIKTVEKWMSQALQLLREELS